ncbi:hypothetical protein MTY_1013 [Moorella thermoacetica Y72]|uniref:Uncharacterized protein n=1 Tax=Moorella thermoacetica Y72 TaxID=1325331 RepID=A0A0S6UBX7_NEOTH|nr:hypothetical protein MTY_1013 [Moorella thermoacetica Y72]
MDSTRTRWASFWTCPLVTGVSGQTTCRWSFFNPMARAVFLSVSGRPMRLLTRVILKFATAYSS